LSPCIAFRVGSERQNCRLAALSGPAWQNPLDKINSAGFSARGTLKRSDFGMKTFLGAIGDEIDLIIEIEAKQKS
jgi:polyisoprenoid-binding protein YceI